MPLHGKIVVIKRSGADGTEFPLTAQSCLFGRKPDCDIRIQLPHVSKEHCKIEVNENKEVIVTNLSTVNPTRLNGKIVHQSESLKDRDVITIIDRSFRFEYPPELTPKKRRLSASAKNETLQQVKDTVCLSPGNQRKSTTLTSDASYDLKEAKVIGTELLSEAHIKNATPGEKDASDTEFAHNHRGNQEKLLEGLSPFSQLYKTLKLQFQANDDHQASSKGGKTPRKASCDAAQTPLSRRKSDPISPTRAVKMPMEVKSTPLPQAPLSRKTPNRGRKSFVCEKSAEEAMLQNLVSCVSSEEKNTSEDQLNKEIIDSPRSRRRSKVANDLQSDVVNGETSQITSNMTNIIVTPKNNRRSTSHGRSSIHIVTLADNEDDGFVEPSVSDNEGSSVNSTPKSTGKGRPRKSPLKDDHAGGNYSVCESVKEKPTVVENLISTDQGTPKRRRRSSQPTPVKSAEKEKDSGEEAQHKQDLFSKAKETPKSKRNSSQFTLQRSISADEVLKEIQELPSSAKKSSEEMVSGGKKTEMPKKGRKSIASEPDLAPKKVSFSPRWRSRSLSPASLETQDPFKKNVNGIITPQEEKKVATPKKTQKSPVINEVSPKQKIPNSSPTRRHSGKAMLKAEEVLSEIESLAPPSGENGAVETGTKKTSSKKRRSGELQEKLAEPPLKRKRVSFAGHLSPELFDKRLPPDSPLRKGAMPTRFSLSVGSKGPSVLRRASAIGIKYSLIKEFSEDILSSLKPSPNKKASPKKTPSKPNTLSPDKKTPKLIAKTPSPARSVAKNPSPGRKSLAGAAKTPTLTSLTAKIPSSDQKSPNVADVEPSPGQKSPTSAAKTPSLTRSVAKTTSPGRQLPASALTIIKTPPPGRKSPARSVTMTPSPARSVTKMPSPATAITKTPPPGRKSPTRSVTKTPSPARSVTKMPYPARSVTRTPSPARSVTRTPSPARSVTKMPSPATTITKTPPPGGKSPARFVTKTPSSARSVTKTSSPARSVTRTPSSNRKSLSSTAKTPSPAMSLAKTPSPGRKSLTGAAKTPSPSGAAKTPPSSRRSLAGAAEMPSANKSVTKTPSTGRKSLRTNANTTPVVSTATPKSGTPYVSGRFSISHISTPSPIPEQSTVASKAEPVAEEIHLDAVTPKPSLRRKNIQSTAKKTPSRRKSSGLDALRSRSGASKANLLVARSWADIVKLGAAKTQGMVFAKKQVPKVKKVTIKKVTSKMPKTPVKKIKDHFSTGHADSPVTIVVGRAHARAVKTAGQVPKLVRNVALMKRSMEMNESFTGIAEMFSTPVNEKPRRTPRRSSASTEVVCSTPVSLTDVSVLNTPEETGEMVVSPLSAPSTARHGRYKDAVICLQEKESSYRGVKTPAKEIIAPINLSGGSQVRVQPSEEVVDTSEKMQTLVVKTAAEIDEACKKLMRTPKQKAEPLVALTGVKRLMKTPKQKSKQIEDFRGIKRLMRTPKEPKVQIIEDLVGVKRVMTTPKQKASPVEDMVGIKRLMRTPKHKGESVEDMSGISRTMKSPKLKIAPIEDVAGLQELMEQPEEKKQDHESRVNIETLEASETKRESKKNESVKTLAILAQSSIAAQQPPSRRSRREDGQISVLPTPLNNSGRTEQVKLTMDIEEDSAVKSSTDTPNGSVKASPAQTASTRKSGRGRKASDGELSSLEAISVEVRSVKSDNISKPTTECVKLSPTPKRATHGTENKDTSRSDTLGSSAFEIALVQESSIDSIKLSTPSRRSQHGNEKDTVQNESSLLSPPANKPQRGKKGMQNVEQNHASIELSDLTVEIVKASPVSTKWTHSGQIKEVEMPATPLATKSGKETKQKIEEVAHMLNEVAAAEERVSQSVSSPSAKRSHHGAIKDVAELDTSASPAAMKKALRGRKARHHSDDTQETSTEVVAAESVMHLPMLKRSQRGAVKDVTEKAITSSPAPKKSGRGRKAKQNSEDKHETSTEVVAAENVMSLPMSKRSRRGAVNDIVEEEITASPAPQKKSGRGRKAKPNSDDIQETSAEVVVAEESSPFSTAERAEQGAVKSTTELETTASPAPIKTSGRGRKAKPNSDVTQVTAVKVVSAGESLPESVMRTPRTKRSQGVVKDTAELETTASPAPTKKSGRGRKAKQNSKDQPEPFTEVVAAEESCPENVILSPATKRLQQGAVKGTVGVETTTSPAPTKKSGRGRKPKSNLDGRHETPVEAVAAESVMSSPSTKRSRRGAKRDSAEVETTISSAPKKISGRGRKAKQNTEDIRETSLEVVAVEESCPESLMLSSTTKRSRRGVVNHAAEVKTIASPAHAKKYGRGRTAKQNSNDTQETSIEVTAAEKNCPESVMPSPTTKRSQRGAMKNTAEVATTAAPIKKSGRGRKVKHVEEVDHTSTDVPEESQAESVKMPPLSKRSRQCSIEDTDMQKTRRGKKVAPVRETRGATKKNADDAETEELETSKNSVIMDEIKNLAKKNVKWSTVLTVENDAPENIAVEHLPATDKRLQRGKARSEKGETLDLEEVPVQLAKPRRGRPGRKPKMTEAEIVQEQVADEPCSKEESKPAVRVSSKRETSLEIISSNVTVIEKEGLCGKSGSKRKMICKESANFEEQEHLLIEVAPKRGRRGKVKTTVDEEAQSPTGPSASTVEIKAVSVVETMKPRSIKRTGRTKASSQQKLDLPKETNDHVIDESASQAEKPVKSKKPIGRGKRKLELEAETEADVSFLSPLMSTRGKRANLTNEAETRTLETAANDENVTRGKVSRRGAAASDKKTAATKTEGKPVRSTRRR